MMNAILKPPTMPDRLGNYPKSSFAALPQHSFFFLVIFDKEKDLVQENSCLLFEMMAGKFEHALFMGHSLNY